VHATHDCRTSGFAIPSTSTLTKPTVAECPHAGHAPSIVRSLGISTTPLEDTDVRCLSSSSSPRGVIQKVMLSMTADVDHVGDGFGFDRTGSPKAGAFPKRLRRKGGATATV